jgi:hypothetical protein
MGINPNYFTPDDIWNYFRTKQLQDLKLDIKDEYVKVMMKLLKPNKYIKFTGSPIYRGRFNRKQMEVEGNIKKSVNVPRDYARIDITMDNDRTYSLYMNKSVRLYDENPNKVKQIINKWWEK